MWASTQNDAAAAPAAGGAPLVKGEEVLVLVLFSPGKASEHVLFGDFGFI